MLSGSAQTQAVESNQAIEGPAFHLLFEGVGSVVETMYAPALRSIIDTMPLRLILTFVDKSETYAGNQTMVRKVRQLCEMLDELQSDTVQVVHLDKSGQSSADFESALDLLPPCDAVIVATPDHTHVDIAKEWLARARRPGIVIIEKPLDSSIRKAEELEDSSYFHVNSVRAYDHYLSKVAFTQLQWDVLIDWLGGAISEFTFYLFEDHSGGDERYCGSIGHDRVRDGAIENEVRTDALRHGVILDLMPHVFAVLNNFCPISSVELTSVRAGRYIGVDGDPNKPTEIAGETFAEIRWRCLDSADQPNVVHGRAYVGKGVRGSRNLGDKYNHDTKVLDIIGAEGFWTRLDLRRRGDGAGQAYLMHYNQLEAILPLPTDAHRDILTKIITRNRELVIGSTLRVADAADLLRKIQEIRDSVPEGSALSQYRGGMQERPGVEGRQAPLLEDLELSQMPLSVDTTSTSMEGGEC